MLEIFLWIQIVGAALLAWALFSRWLLINPRGDAVTGLLVRGYQIYVKLMHNLKVTGWQHVPMTNSPGPLIVVANHTAGIDPIVVQAFTPFEVRWLMAADMQIKTAKEFWKWSGVISVRRGEQDAAAVRTAIRHLRDAGKSPERTPAIGVFPEGALERPPEQVMPFMPGIGMLIKAGRCPVLPVIIRGTPQVDPAWASMWRTSRTSVEFKEPLSYAGAEWTPETIAEDLRQKYIEWTGWPANDDPPELPPIPDESDD